MNFVLANLQFDSSEYENLKFEQITGIANARPYHRRITNSAEQKKQFTISNSQLAIRNSQFTMRLPQPPKTPFPWGRAGDRLNERTQKIALFGFFFIYN